MIRAVETGMSIEQFWAATWREFQIYVLAYERRELQEMRRTRAIAHMIYSANSDKPMSVEKFWPLHGDPKEPERVPIDPSQYGKIFDLYR